MSSSSSSSSRTVVFGFDCLNVMLLLDSAEYCWCGCCCCYCHSTTLFLAPFSSLSHFHASTICQFFSSLSHISDHQVYVHMYECLVNPLIFFFVFFFCSRFVSSYLCLVHHSTNLSLTFTFGANLIIRNAFKLIGNRPQHFDAYQCIMHCICLFVFMDIGS